MYAVKGNMQLTINDADAATYQNQGFDIFDNSGKRVALATNKTIPYAEHLAILAKAKGPKVRDLEAKIQQLEKDNADLQALVDEYKAQENQPDDSGDEFK